MNRFVSPVAETMSVEELRLYKKQVNTKNYYQVGINRILRRYSLLFLYKLLNIFGVPFENVLAFWMQTSKVLDYGERFIQKIFFGSLGKLQSPVSTKSRTVKYISTHYFVLRYWHLSLVYIVPAIIIYNLIVNIKNRLDKELQLQLEIKEKMNEAQSYDEWIQYVLQIQDMQTKRKQQVKTSKFYDRALVIAKTQELLEMKKEGDIQKLMFWARNDLWRDFANINNWEIFHNSCTVPRPIVHYMEVVMQILDKIANYSGNAISQSEKLACFQNVRHAYGRSALMFSGGGALGIFHLGVVKVLLEHQLLPRIIAGSSVGAIVAALVATHTDQELRLSFSGENINKLNMGFFNNQSMRQIIRHYLNKGALQDMEHFKETLQHHYKNYTFQEAYEKTGRVLNIVVTSVGAKEPARLFNHLTTPAVVIWSAVAASSAFPGLFMPTDILAKNANGEYTSIGGQVSTRKWQDGSLKEDLPFQGLAEIFNVNNFIVSQTNPHIVPLLNLKNNLSSRTGSVIETEFKMRIMQLKQFMPDWVPEFWLAVFSQPWEGNITIVLPNEFSSFGKAIRNPSMNDLSKAIRQGEIETWAKLAAIQCNTQVEQKLDACINRINKTMSMTRLQSTTQFQHATNMNHLPSWNNLQHMGQVNPMQNQVEGSTDSMALLLGDNNEPLPRGTVELNKMKSFKTMGQKQYERNEQDQLLEEASQYSSPVSNKDPNRSQSVQSLMGRSSDSLDDLVQYKDSYTSKQSDYQPPESTFQQTDGKLQSEGDQNDQKPKRNLSSLWSQLIPLAQTAFELQERKTRFTQ